MLKEPFKVVALSIVACIASPLYEADSRTANASTVTPNSICAIPKLMMKKRHLKITLEADFISDRMENSLLVDARCPGIVVVPYDGSQTIIDDSYRDFERILSANPLQIRAVKAHVRVYGLLKKRKGKLYRLDVLRYIDVSEQS